MNKIWNNTFVILTFVFLIAGFSNLFAQPEIEAIERYKPADQNTSDSEIYWIVYFTNPINGKTMDADDYKLSVTSGKFSGEQYVHDFWQNDKSGYEWIVGATEVYSEDGTIRLDFVGYVENTKGAGTSKGYSFTKGDTYIYGEGGGSTAPEVSVINRYNPSQQNILTQDLVWYVAFSTPIDTKTLTTKDFTATTTSGNVSGTITEVEAFGNQEFLVYFSDVTGTGNVRLDFTGTVTGESGDDSKGTYTKGQLYSLLTPVGVSSIKRYIPSAQQVKANSVSYRVIFTRSINAGTLSSTDFKLTATDGTLNGYISSVSGSGTTYTVTVSGITKDETLRLDFTGSVNDTYNLPSSGTFTTGETYILDFTAPKMEKVSIVGNGQNPDEVIPEQTVTVNFRSNEPLFIISAFINGKPVIGTGDGSTVGKISYTFGKEDEQGPITFEVTLQDIAGNITTFSQTTDGSMLNFFVPPPQALIISQPTDVIECEGSLDQFLFVVAAPDQKGLKIAYRWWKDGKPYSSWVEDFGQITFDTLEFGMSGTYRAELFAFDPSYNAGPFSYEAARVSERIFSTPANLYVLQQSSFMSEINNISANEGTDVVLTFEANVYGEHNMEDPTYWTDIQWYMGDVALLDNDRYEGTNASILTINNIQATDYADNYRVRLIGNCDTVWSNSFSIKSEPLVNITIQPVGTTGCLNDEVQLITEAESTVSGVNLEYHWMVDGVMVVDEVGKFNGSNTNTLSVTLNPALGYDGTEEYTCQINPVGFPDNFVTSDPAMITWEMPPVIVTDLQNNYSEKEDGTLELFVELTGGNLTYEWTKDGNDLGVNNDTLTLQNLTPSDAGIYKVTISNNCGSTVSVLANVEVTQGPVVTDVPLQEQIGLHQNYPNPFSSNSTISWNSQSGGYASMELTDLMGNKIATLLDGNVGAGFNKVEINSDKLNLSTGTYYVIFRLNNIVETKQITVVK